VGRDINCRKKKCSCIHIEKESGWEEQAMQFLNTKFKSVASFRSWFLGRAKYKASKFYKKLCKVADLYYDTIEGKIQ